MSDYEAFEFSTAKKEQDFIQEFCGKYAFPDYNEIVELAYKVAEQRKDMTAAIMFSWLPEYGELNHQWCKEMYESGFDKEVCKKMGENIYKRGGMDALRGNFYMMCWFSPCGWNVGLYENDRCRQDVIRYAPKQLNGHWGGIGEWIA